MMNNNENPQEAANYSELLMQFFATFEDKFPDDGIFEYALADAVDAWNLGNMSLIAKENNSEINIKDGLEGAENPELIEEMANHKIEKFADYPFFIVDFTVEETEGEEDWTVEVVTEEPDAYITRMAQHYEEDNLTSEEDFEDHFIDRFALVLKPKQPFIDWVTSNQFTDANDQEFLEPNIYLVDEDTDDLKSWLKENFAAYFEMELELWADEDEWPKDRTYQMFEAWLRIDYSTMVYDMEKKPVRKRLD